MRTPDPQIRIWCSTASYSDAGTQMFRIFERLIGDPRMGLRPARGGVAEAGSDHCMPQSAPNQQ